MDNKSEIIALIQNKQLLENLKNGIYGLEYTLFEKQQIANLKAGGFIQEDEETDYEEEE